jgi:hypothetical protein
VPTPAPEQVQLNTRSAGVGVAVGIGATVASTGAIAVVTGAGSCAGAAGGGTGAIRGFPVCAQSKAPPRGQISATAKIAAIKPIAIPFTVRIVFPLIGTNRSIR